MESDISRQFYYNGISAVIEVYSRCYGSLEKDTQLKLKRFPRGNDP